MSAKADRNIMAAIVLGGAAAVVAWLYTVNKAAAAGGAAPPATGTGAVVRFAPDRRRLSGWGSYGTPGFSGGGRTGAAVYWRRVS